MRPPKTPERRCRDCNGVISDYVIPGYHAPRWVAGVLVNCVGRRIQ
jgi:hypothetical protein